MTKCILWVNSYFETYLNRQTPVFNPSEDGNINKNETTMCFIQKTGTTPVGAKMQAYKGKNKHSLYEVCKSSVFILLKIFQ